MILVRKTSIFWVKQDTFASFLMQEAHRLILESGRSVATYFCPQTIFTTHALIFYSMSYGTIYLRILKCFLYMRGCQRLPDNVKIYFLN